ncbi:unnamed protein product [Ilex paraguariensis]|uniref:Uncharacterized protein n=1 Tax=Ilex paraguariensis TaxID=185542 RepID=A0ABC8UWD1_9AQUA
MSQTIDHIALSIDQELACLTRTPLNPCIFKVYRELCIENEKAYEPKIITIGLFHHGKDNLQEMEEHKIRYLQLLLHRRNEKSVNKYVMALSDMEERTRNCYAESSGLNKAEFVKMVLLEGIFVIELFRKWNARSSYTNDPVVQSFRMLRVICRDLLLLENQLPFFILVHLFNMTRDLDTQEDISYLALSLLDNILPGPAVSHVSNIPEDEVKHLLHLIHGSMCSSFAKKVESCGEVSRFEVDKFELMNTITDLQEAGIAFKFLPDKTHRRYVSDYALLMDCLVNSPKDASFLHCCRIITNALGDDIVVCNTLNKLVNGVTLSTNFSYFQVFNNLNKHCKSPYNKWMANLRHNYFNSPWALISFLAAVVLLLLTVAQTIFSALSYF